jgi:Tfp pilus assembly pilus retraction ATPase PilT
MAGAPGTLKKIEDLIRAEYLPLLEQALREGDLVCRVIEEFCLSYDEAQMLRFFTTGFKGLVQIAHHTGAGKDLTYQEVVEAAEELGFQRPC